MMTIEDKHMICNECETVAHCLKDGCVPKQPPASVQEPADDGFTQALIERDEYHAIADELAEMIAQITGEDIGEHTSANFPWRNALDAAENWLCHSPAAPYVASQLVQEPVAYEYGDDVFWHDSPDINDYIRANGKPLVYATSPYVATPLDETASLAAPYVAPQLVQEPVAWEQELANILCRIHRDGGHYVAEHGWSKAINDADLKVAQLNAAFDTTPPNVATPPAAQRQWQGLTDEEKQEWIDAMPYTIEPRHCMILVNVMEAKLKAKNSP